jgi:hypothetical protein
MSNSFNSIPSTGDLWNVYVNVRTGRLDLWESLVPRFRYNPNVPFFETAVPTRETVRMGYIMERLLAVNQPVLFTGWTGNSRPPVFLFTALTVTTRAFLQATILNLLHVTQLKVWTKHSFDWDISSGMLTRLWAGLLTNWDPIPGKDKRSLPLT